MDALEMLFNRKSVRHFTGAAVSREALETLLRAGMAAPSAVNKQPWAFIAVTRRDILDRLAEGLPYAKMLDKAGAAIVVCGLEEKANAGMREYVIIDCSAATENILLAAEALGLGAVWTAAYPRPEREAWVRTVLGLPENVVPLCVIPVGHPTGEDRPKDKFNPANIHWERW
ncbi:MAG TPA: nitroreductase family protein [bacterium]|nr:nitroreductase family protein [bacterium]HQG46796.1 nitroreductase family protein [bacterium]HQI47968.1 nitroreductase family protein [bacterium]HQJ65631.1 nitroreductase family protein [bacterium]